jgi:hypothetical protein
MAKKLDKEMLKMMTITERFNYINNLKEMKMNISQARAEQDPKEYPWVDEDNDDYDSFSDGSESDSNGWEDDSNEY